MNQDDITKEQAAKLAKAIGGTLGYLFKLRERMVKVGFVPSDPLFTLVDNAYDALHRLWIDLHYKSCGIGHHLERPVPTFQEDENKKA